jgi:hypothetical protein
MPISRRSGARERERRRSKKTRSLTSSQFTKGETQKKSDEEEAPMVFSMWSYTKKSQNTPVWLITHNVFKHYSPAEPASAFSSMAEPVLRVQNCRVRQTHART